MCVPGGSPGLGWAPAVQEVVTQSARFHTGLTLTVDSFRAGIYPRGLRQGSAMGSKQQQIRSC